MKNEIEVLEWIKLNWNWYKIWWYKNVYVGIYISIADHVAHVSNVSLDIASRDIPPRLLAMQ